MNLFKRTSLRDQLHRRLFLAFVFVAAFGCILLLAGYKTLVARAAHDGAEADLRHVERNIELQRANWERSAGEVKTQIDFMRIFADSDQAGSWLKLHAYFASLEGKVSRFPSGVVTSPNGKVLLAFGQDGQAFGRLIDGDVRLPAWYYSSAHRSLYALVSTPLWIGNQGNGRLTLLQPLDNALMHTLAPHDARLLLALNNRVISSSRGALDEGNSVTMDDSERVSYESITAEQRTLALFGSDPAAPRLVLQYTVREPISPPVIFLSTVALLALFTAILWSAIGRWSARMTLRVERLSKASELFVANHQLSDQVRAEFDAAITAPDEISKVAQSSMDLMQSIEMFDQEHFAFLQTLEMLEEGVVEVNADGEYLRASPGWQRLSNAPVECGVDTIFEAIHPEDEPDFRHQLEQLFSGAKASLIGRARLRHTDVKDLWVEYRFIPGDLKSKKRNTVSGVLRDITQSYLLEKHISHMALHDALTELPNRILFEDRTKVALRAAKRKGNKVAVGFVDLDHFKNVNDQHGHHAGDQLLVTLATNLKASLRSGDTLARWGGDEFVVLLTDLGNVQDARDVMTKFASSCQQAIVVDGNSFNVTVSLGVAVFPDDGENVDVLLSQADRAMFFAKEQGRNTIRFVSDMAGRDQERRTLYIQNKLATAIKDQKLTVWFQPIVDARTERVVACEALARWHDETYGWVSPATFIPMAENLGLIRELGHQIWIQTVASMERWKRMGIELRVAINVSRRQLFIPSFTADLLDDLAALDLSPAMIDLEITESVAMEDAEHTTRRLSELTSAKFGIAIDDFGTGYSSLSQLHEMPATKVKIDISFVQRAHLPQGEQLIQAIVKIASAFNMNTVAEGVEEAHTASLLRELGVNQLQGYHFARPMDADHFEDYLRESLTTP